MKWWVSSQSLWAIAGVVALALLLNLMTVRAGATRMIVPTAESVAEEMVKALRAHRYEGAIEQLVDELAATTGEEDLRAVVQRMEKAHGGIEKAEAQPAEEQGDTATVGVEVELADGKKREVSFPLEKENELWKVAGLDGLTSLAK